MDQPSLVRAILLLLLVYAVGIGPKTLAVCAARRPRCAKRYEIVAGSNGIAPIVAAPSNLCHVGAE